MFDQIDLLDVAGPFEVFSITRLKEKENDGSSPFKVILIAEKLDQISTVGGLRLTPDVSFDNCPKLDLFIVPGRWGTRKQVDNLSLVKWIENRSSQAKITASICIGSSLLGKTGLLNGREYTTHFQTFDFLRQSAPNTKIREDILFTLAEPMFTSAGVYAGIDLSLQIVSHFFGTEVGRATSRHTEYPYPVENKRRYSLSLSIYLSFMMTVFFT